MAALINLDFFNQMLSKMHALKKHPESDRIIQEMRKQVPDEHYHQAMIKTACSHLVDCSGRYALIMLILNKFHYYPVFGGTTAFHIILTALYYNRLSLVYTVILLQWHVNNF